MVNQLIKSKNLNLNFRDHKSFTGSSISGSYLDKDNSGTSFEKSIDEIE